ncbi:MULTISPECIES: helix-turn-helix domain-containing protein [Staphylococcus]|uniref:helix-turn-helix domain-containing protein n=1 Tax=Staphylococcus TaxID=1279 RepID=UPI0007A07AF8|nr:MULTISPECIES: helix-turn-helix transcriptional regulator [Staphylococcus]AMW23490.1 DNA-binding protein [Staphylococcus haemolyticus]MBD3928374.1 helix-turn-helix transcriptional regulator [Staphylococcus haemolyticus]MCC2093316.1 helix-turn-helix transcriptional regulator [Staphylococcus haemolyticus]MDO0959906.1 helix-turn-helix transcriptional regulator [Staphylococcus haemolyticus]OHO95281.1 transcriptional regulator [Staphylococcus sp. HMSC057G10]
MIQSRLSVLMAERGLKISDLYEETGISKTTLMAIAENNGKGVQFDTVDKLCNFLGVTPCEFFEYSPYLVSFQMDKIDSDKNLPIDFTITIKNQNYEKLFYFNVFIYLGNSYDIPVRKDEFKAYINVGLESSDHYNDEEFYNFISNLTISFRTDFINKIIGSITSLLLDFKEVKTIDRKSISFKKGDYIALGLFKESEYETLKKITLK